MLTARQRRAAEAQQYIIDFIFTHGAGFIATWLEVTMTTVRRWESGKSRVPKAAIVALEAYRGRLPGMDQASRWRGAVIRDGRLYMEDWNRGFLPGEIAAIPRLESLIEMQAAEKNRLKAELGKARAELAETDIAANDAHPEGSWPVRAMPLMDITPRKRGKRKA